MRTLTGLLLAWSTVAGGSRAQASFQGLGDLPGSAFQSGANGVSGDGGVITGTGINALENIEPFRWAGSMSGLGFLPGGTEGAGTAISADGSVIVGFSENSSGDAEAFRWTASGGMIGLGDLPGGVFQSFARGVSADGSTVVGESRTDAGNQAVRWAGGGPEALGDLPGGSVISVARAASGDGTVVVGAANIDGGGTFGEAFRWTESGGMVGLGTLAGYSLSIAFDVSDDGSVVVGQAVGTAGSEAFRWTATGGMQPLGDLPGAAFASRALAVSADGSTIVGAAVAEGNRTDAFVWTEADGLRSLTVILGNAGIDVSGWTLVALGVSDDGSVVVGQGTNPQGEQEAWRAVLPGACAEPFATRSWLNPAGGAFGDPNNWSTSAVPTGADRALFGLGDGVDYTVTFAAGHASDQVLLRGGNHVRFALGGQSYEVDASSGCGSSVDVADGFGSPILEIENGSIVGNGGARVNGPAGTELVARAGGTFLLGGALGVGMEAGRTGHIRVESGGEFNLTSEGVATIGGAGAGSLTVEGGGGAAFFGAVRLGDAGGGRGELLATGSGANLALFGSTVVGASGEGRLVGSDAAVIDAREVVLGRLAEGDGMLVVETGAQVSARDIDVGVDGLGRVRVRTLGGLIVSGGVTIPRGPGPGSVRVTSTAGMSAGIIRLRAGGSLNVGGLVATGQLIHDESGQLNLSGGCLTIQGGPCQTNRAGAGGTVEADTVWIGPGAGFDSTTVQLGPGGVLGGAGALPLDLTNAGTINPGDSAGVAGTFTVGGAYSQAPAGVLEAELAGTTSHDALAVTGAAVLNGVLRFRYLGGFIPSPGDAFTVLTAGSVAGEFASADGPAGSTFSLAYGPTSVTATVLTVAAEPPAGAQVLALYPPAPNPARDVAAIRYDLPAAGRVRLAVYDALGREVAVLVDGDRPAGAHEVYLGTRALAPGLYVARLRAGERARSRTLLVSR